MLSEPLVIRRARPEDAADVVKLLADAKLEVAFDPSEFRVARLGGRVIACARLKPLPDGTLELASVAVREDLRGKGIGEKLVRATLDVAKAPVVALAVAPGFFERLGLRRLDHVPVALRQKAEGMCSSSGAVPMGLGVDEPTVAIRARYAEVARSRGGGPDLGLGTGDPVTVAAPRPGEVVLDLGSGAGVDVIAAAKLVGPSGRAIGVDFTPEMVERARKHACAEGLANAEFLGGRLEELPLPDATADVIVSNCVVNLSVDKPAALREAWRVLKPGGRLAISDTLRVGGPPQAPTCGCETGAMSEPEWRAGLRQAGFVDVDVAPEAPGGCCGGTGRVMVRARKPA